MVQAVDDARHAARQRHPGKGNPVAHRVAGADLDRDTRFVGELVQFVHKGQHEAVEIGAGDVLEVAARANAGLKRLADHGEVMIDRFPPGHAQFVEDVIIGAGNQDAGFLDSQIPHQLEVVFSGADPGCDFRKLQSQILTAAHRFAVAVVVNEKLGLPDNPLGPAQPGQQLVQLHDLLRGIGGLRLLPVTEGGVGDEDLLRHVHRDAAVVEGDFRNLVILKNLPVQMRLSYVLQRVCVGPLLQKI